MQLTGISLFWNADYLEPPEATGIIFIHHSHGFNTLPFTGQGIEKKPGFKL